jgi:hypothetical protein
MLPRNISKILLLGIVIIVKIKNLKGKEIAIGIILLSVKNAEI